MSNRTELRIRLGMTQEQMALFLGISRGQYSMYESGLRPIPDQASQLAGQLAMVVNEASAQKQKVPSEKEKETHRQVLQFLLNENRYQIARTERAIAIIDARQQAFDKRSVLQDILSQATQAKEGVSDKKIAALVGRTTYPKAKEDVTKQLKLEVRLEVLNLEKTVLEERLKNAR